MTRPTGGRRLDPRTVVVQPVQQIGPLLPIPVAILVFGRNVSGMTVAFTALGVVVLLVASVLSWLRFRYELAGDRLEVVSGLVNVRRRVVPVDRIRGVDVEAKLTHRLLGVAVVRVDVGASEGDDDEVRLNAVSRDEARELRTLLLRAAREPAGPADPTAPVPASAPAPEPGAGVLLRVPPRWLLYGPLFGALLLAVPSGFAAAYGAIRQFGVVDDPVGQAIDGVAEGDRDPTAYLWVIPVVLVGLPLCALALAALWYGRWIVQDAGPELRIERGVLTQRTVSLERARLRGHVLHEPLLGRRLRVARLTALLSGLDGADRSMLVPLGPREDLEGLAGRLRGRFTGTLRRHPRAALRRRMIRALLPGTAALATGIWLADPWVLGGSVLLLAGGAALGLDLYRNLGHGLSATLLAVRSGSLVRRTEVVGRADPIGMRVRQTYVQRRAGLATVEVALVAGSATTISDMAAAEVAALATDLLPRVAGPLVVTGPSSAAVPSPGTPGSPPGSPRC